MNISPDTIDVQKIPAPSSSPTMSSERSPEAAAREENMSGHPFPNASNVTPYGEVALIQYEMIRALCRNVRR